MSLWRRRVTNRHERYCKHVRLYELGRGLRDVLLWAFFMGEFFLLGCVAYNLGRVLEHEYAFEEGVAHANVTRLQKVAVDSDQPPPEAVAAAMDKTLGAETNGTWFKTKLGDWMFQPQGVYYIVGGHGDTWVERHEIE